MINQRIKIVVLGTRGFPNVQGGVEKHCEELYPIIVALGHDVTVITRKSYVDPSISEYKGVKLYPVANPTKKSLEAIIHTTKGVFVAKRLGCDVLHIHAIGPSLIVPLARLLGLRVVITNHGPDYDRQKWGGLAKTVLKMGECLGSLFANQIITISKTISNIVKNKYKKTSNLIPNGVVLPEMTTSDNVLQNYGLRKGNYFLAVGRFVPEKGFCDLIKAFCEARMDTNQTRIGTNKTTNWKLVIVGDADHEDDYSRSVKTLAKGNDNIILTGRLTWEPLKALYAHAGVFVLPSYHEGLPIVLLEAMSFGLSCIVSNIPANMEVTLDQDRYFTAGDIDGIAEKLKEFATTPLTVEQKKSQVKYIKENFNWEKIAEATIEVYKKATIKKRNNYYE